MSENVFTMAVLFRDLFPIHCDVSCQGSTAFKEALRLMSMDTGKALENDETGTITPACKKPKLADVVSLNLDLTPPPVVGSQTDSRHTLTEGGTTVFCDLAMKS